MTVIIDSEDGFTYNLYQELAGLGAAKIINGGLDALDLIALNPSRVVLLGSEKADIIKQLGATIPILGVGEGLRAICETFGGTLKPEIMHGKSALVNLDNGCPLFKGLPPKINAGMYYSYIIDALPQELLPTAFDSEGRIMAIKHREYKIFGLQFEPSSILTENGNMILRNFLEV
ncbi:MAG TPA: gamma-glutamyl-gamma-aminobutyrate hydrolase family protein [Clostridia bacterium]